jgi:hypothetical protein
MVVHVDRRNKIAVSPVPGTLAHILILVAEAHAHAREVRVTDGGATRGSIRRRVRSPEGERATVEPVHDGALR